MTAIIANLALVLAAGWLFRRFEIVGEGAEKAFNQYLYYLALPALIIVKIADTPLAGLGWRFLAVNTLPLAALMAAAWGLWKAGRIDWRLARLLIIVSALGNTVYLGFPVAAMRLGEEAIGYAAIASSVHNVLIFTFGFLLMTSVCERDCPPARFLRMISRSVVLWASLAGLVMAWWGLRLPELPHRVLSDIGKTTLPLSLFTLGVGLYGKKIAHNLPRIALVSGLKLVLLPFFYLLAALAFGYTGFVSRVVFIEMVMPVAVMNYIVAREFDFDEDLVGQSILLSTLAFFPLLYLYDWAMLRFL
ncbi:MAG: AEC family transporter [Elusimicrobiales bacterium]|nr:AEC family transporter [Elusimicrobiales bacterium]